MVRRTPGSIPSSRRWALVGAAALALVIAAVGPRSSAQYCIGTTLYTVRDERGVPMGADQLRQLSVVSVDGRPAQPIEGASPPAFEAPFGSRRMPYRIALATPLLIAAIEQCGEIDRLVLRYAGRTMQLRFGVPHHNTRYHFDSLPFQSGRFRITGDGSFPCEGGSGPPRIDNETRGECRVAASRWEPDPTSP